MTYTGPGQVERLAQSATVGSNTYSANYRYNTLGMGKPSDSVTNPPGATFVRDPFGTLIAMRVGDPTSYYYLTCADGSVLNLVTTNGSFVAAYFYCPTGNRAEALSGSLAQVNPFRKWGAFYDRRFKTI